jgi:hypothetical protein
MSRRPFNSSCKLRLHIPASLRLAGAVVGKMRIYKYLIAIILIWIINVGAFGQRFNYKKLGDFNFNISFNQYLKMLKDSSYQILLVDTMGPEPFKIKLAEPHISYKIGSYDSIIVVFRQNKIHYVRLYFSDCTFASDCVHYFNYAYKRKHQEYDADNEFYQYKCSRRVHFGLTRIALKSIYYFIFLPNPDI